MGEIFNKAWRNKGKVAVGSLILAVIGGVAIGVILMNIEQCQSGVTGQILIKQSMVEAYNLRINGKLKEALELYEKLTRENIITEENKEIFGEIYHEKGMCYLGLSENEDREANINMAIWSFGEALEIRVLDKYTKDYANTQRNLGIAHYELYKLGEKEENLEKALESLGDFLEEVPDEKYSEEYVRAKYLFAVVNDTYLNVEGGMGSIEGTINVYESYLQIATPDEYPIDYGNAQHRVGVKYRELAEERDREENLRMSVKSFEDAMKVRTPNEYAAGYAVTKRNLGITYHNLGNTYYEMSNEGDKEHNLKLSYSAFQKALDIFKAEEYSVGSDIIKNIEDHMDVIRLILGFSP